MKSDRRRWIRQIGLGIAGIGMAPLNNFASPEHTLLKFNPGNVPIKLSSNENPYGPSPMARLAMAENINISNRYNWDLTDELIKDIAKKNDVTPEHIIMGAGSTEILELVARYAALKKGSFIIADPSYMYWTKIAQHLGLKKITIPLTPDKLHDLPAMLKAIQPGTRLIYICNPNNPTGTMCSRDELVKFINEATKKTLVLVDEAYLDFTTQQTLGNLVTKTNNLVIAKTFSKIYGLAGARIGYGIGHSDLLHQLIQLQSWSNGSVSVASTAAALASLKDEKFIADTYSLNEKVRSYTIEQLERFNITCIPSNSNFIYFSLGKYKKDFFEQLKNNNVLGTRIYEEQGKWSRITVGTMQEMQKFIHALE